MHRPIITKWELDEVLEQSLSQIAAGKAGVEACLASNPGMAGELEPLLLAAQRLWAIPKPVLSPEAKARIEAQVLAAAAASPILRPVRRRWPRVALPRWGWAFSALAAVFVCVVLTMTTVVTASAQALPGSGLYPVKLATEEAWLRLAPARQEPRLHLRFAQRRLAEAEELAERGRFEPSVLEAMVDHVEAALTEVEKLPPDQALPLLVEAQAQIEAEQQMLSRLQAALPPATQPDLARTLGEMAALVEWVGEIRRGIGPYKPVASASPTGPLEASGTPTARLLPTQTDEPSPSPTVMPTPTAVPTATGTPASRTRPTSRALPTTLPSPPTSTSRPTSTPLPPPTDTPPPPPTNTPPPAPTTRVPPGQTKTPQPPGQTKTPKPAHVRPASTPRPTRTPRVCNPTDVDGLYALILGQGGAAGKVAFTAWMWVSHGPEVLAQRAKSNQTLTAFQRDFNKGAV